MLSDTQQFDRRNAIVRLLRNGLVHKQGDLVHMLQRDGYAVTQSSISRDLRDLGHAPQLIKTERFGPIHLRKRTEPR